jgi:signal transduction histidine kinase
LSEKSGVKLNIEAVRFPLVETIEETLKTLRNRAVQKGLVLESSLQPGLPIDVLGDPVRLRQVLTNLCDNAIKFTGQGGVYVVVLGLQAMLFQAAWVASEGQKKARRSDGLFIMGVI